MIIFFIFGLATSYDFHKTPEEIDEEINEKVVYYGSTVRIEHQSEYFLHSHTVTYGSGSGQQSVTGMRTDHDYNSLWTLKECFNQKLKKYDDVVKCGDCIRLEHMMTQRNLHSHFHQSPISYNQEVSAFGEEGNGNESDDWILECDGSTKELTGSQWFTLKHRLTNKYLRASKSHHFNTRNCGHNCPIEGQLEISAVSVTSQDTKWKIYAGLFYKKIESDEGRHCNDYGDCDDIEADDDEYQTVKQDL